MLQPTTIPEHPNIALLIACEGTRTQRPLRGTGHDLDRIQSMLPDSFEVVRIEGEQATRAIILDRLAWLEPPVPGGQVLIAVSCHGSRLVHGKESYPFLVTNDHPRVDGGFGGILAAELWPALARLTQLTCVVTFILDSCIAAEIARGSSVAEPDDDRLRIKMAEPHQLRASDELPEGPLTAATFTEWLRQPSSIEQHPNANPWVVRMSATGAEQPAYETVDAAGKPGGSMIIELAALWHEAVHVMSWEQIASLLRPRVARRNGTRRQRPEAAGPTNRLALMRQSEDVSSNTSVEIDTFGTYLLSGHLHGTALGDEFFTRAQFGGARLRVCEVFDDRSRVEGDWAGRIDDGALAYLRLRGTRVPVALPPGPARACVRELVAGSASLVLVEPGQTPAFRIDATTHGTVIRDASGRVEGHVSFERLVSELEARVRARRFVSFVEAPSANAPAASWTARILCCHEHGGEQLLCGGELLVPGDRVWCEFTNESQDTALYLNVVEHGVDGRVVVRNHDYGLAGLHVPAGQTRGLHRRTRARSGYWVEWPTPTPAAEPRPLTLYLIASDQPLDLRALMGPQPPRGQIIRGSAPMRPALRWACRKLELMLSPSQPSTVSQLAGRPLIRSW